MADPVYTHEACVWLRRQLGLPLLDFRGAMEDSVADGVITVEEVARIYAAAEEQEHMRGVRPRTSLATFYWRHFDDFTPEALADLRERLGGDPARPIGVVFAWAPEHRVLWADRFAGRVTLSLDDVETLVENARYRDGTTTEAVQPLRLLSQLYFEHFTPDALDWLDDFLGATRTAASHHAAWADPELEGDRHWDGRRLADGTVRVTFPENDPGLLQELVVLEHALGQGAYETPYRRVTPGVYDRNRITDGPRFHRPPASGGLAF